MVFRPSDQTGLYHTPLLSKIWDLGEGIFLVEDPINLLQIISIMSIFINWNRQIVKKLIYSHFCIIERKVFLFTRNKVTQEYSNIIFCGSQRRNISRKARLPFILSENSATSWFWGCLKNHNFRKIFPLSESFRQHRIYSKASLRAKCGLIMGTARRE